MTVRVIALLLMCAAVARGQSVRLNWTASSSSGVTGYNVYRGTATGGPYTKIGTATGVSYTDSAVGYNTKYYYVTTAVSSGGESSHSNEASVTTTSAPPAAGPQPGDILQWNGTKWVHHTPASPVSEVLEWNGARWAYAVKKR